MFADQVLGARGRREGEIWGGDGGDRKGEKGEIGGMKKGDEGEGG